FWCTLPQGADMPEFCRQAIRDRKVCVVPGNAFLPDEAAPCRSFRINYTTPSNEKLTRGIELLGGLARDFLR
ncbi:MAG TPA: PLP-dependent aminotransferase family protein, partial [Ruminococcaceae bacterium]|nr:PLP-dependent aminotransferase family protein [Oscillospiraceae bacterium]